MSMTKEKLRTGSDPAAAFNEFSNIYFAMMASVVKRLIVFTAINGMLPAVVATSLIQRLKLEAA